MEQFSADVFYGIGVLLCLVKHQIKHQTDLPGVVGIREGFLEHVVDACNMIGLKQSVKAANRLVEAHRELSEEALRVGIDELEQRIKDELEDHLFMYIPPARARRYHQTEAFGPQVAKNFPSIHFDAWEAGNCFAAGRYTSCVFHLMRAVELGLAAFATVFSLTFNHTNWHNIIEIMESKIRDMGHDPNKPNDWKEKQEKYSQTATNFMIFKDAWRNHTAHARARYTEEEADGIYRNVRAFFQRLAADGLGE